jgi:hypothetical protein
MTVELDIHQIIDLIIISNKILLFFDDNFI